uniref:Uncharacterized protein n=1 Tax=Oryza glumipatula TaxID=40148 RepID=A0A0E0BJ04_9ORYZ
MVTPPGEATHCTVRHAAVEASRRAHTVGRPPEAPSPCEAAGGVAPDPGSPAAGAPSVLAGGEDRRRGRERIARGKGIRTTRGKGVGRVNNLQWILALVPLIKALQMGLSFLFWYSCVHLQTCSLWMSFGVYVTGILFQTASFVLFMLISHGYCIMCERLSIRERRTTACLGCLLYLSLIGYKAAVSYFTVFLLINYFMSFYIIFRRTSQNLLLLREQLNFIEEEDIHSLHGALNTKYTMFKRFQGTMQVALVAFIMVYMRADDTPDNYWFRVLVREWVQFCIFMIPEASLHLPVVPLMKSTWEIAMPPIYSVEMDAADFKGLVSDHWHVGVRTSHNNSGCPSQPLLVLVQNPSPKVSTAATASRL